MAKTILIALFFLLILAWYLSFLASRLDRLHHRVETSWEHLDALLQRRAAIAIEIAHLPTLDPATSLLLTASAFNAREASIIDRSDSESSLTESLKLLQLDENRTLMGDTDLANELLQITEKIRMGITIHLESVQAATNLRSKTIFRFFRLAGHAPLPMRYSFEDDSL